MGFLAFASSGRLAARRAASNASLAPAGFEALDKIFREGEVDAALLDGLGTGFVRQAVSHHALHLAFCKELLLGPRGQHKNQSDQKHQDGRDGGMPYAYLRKQEWQLRVL